VLGALGIFFYVGVEVGLASIAVNFFKTQGMSSLETASDVAALYWFGALVGRLLGSWILTRVKSGTLLGIFGFAAVALVLIAMLGSGHVAIGAVVLCGFFNSIMFPNIFTLGIAGLGPMTSKGSGLIMTAIVGGAVIPALLGWAADKYGIQHAFVIPLILLSLHCVVRAVGIEAERRQLQLLASSFQLGRARPFGDRRGAVVFSVCRI
jgi:MFS transporter, FHS family, L-fucose permease